MLVRGVPDVQTSRSSGAFMLLKYALLEATTAVMNDAGGCAASIAANMFYTGMVEALCPASGIGKPLSVVADTHDDSPPSGPAHHRGRVEPLVTAPSHPCANPDPNTDRRIGVQYLKEAHQSGVNKRHLTLWNY